MCNTNTNIPTIYVGQQFQDEHGQVWTVDKLNNIAAWMKSQEGILTLATLDCLQVAMIQFLEEQAA